jgi:DNA modification methylase
MTAPYWTDGRVTLYLGDCREITEWLSADVLVTDPPYGVQGRYKGLPRRRDLVAITGDDNTAVRDAALEMWRPRPCAAFGDLTLPSPAGTRHTLIYRKPPNAGAYGTIGGWRRDIEAIYLLGLWPVGMAERSSILSTGARSQGTKQRVYGHPHAKPVDVMEAILAACPPGVIADPFAGSGSTLIAARNQGRLAIGIEVFEPYCEMAARRLAQGVLVAEEPVA